MGRFRRRKIKWIKCPACGAHATQIRKAFYCRKCGKEDEIQK